MAILIATKTQKKVLSKSLITIGSTNDCDFVVNIGKEKLIIQYSVARGKYIVANKFNNPKIFLNGNPFKGAILLNNTIKFDVAGTDEQIAIKVVKLSQEKEAASGENEPQPSIQPQQAL